MHEILNQIFKSDAIILTFKMAIEMMMISNMRTICTPSLDDRWEGLDGHWGADTINPFTPPSLGPRVPLPCKIIRILYINPFTPPRPRVPLLCKICFYSSPVVVPLPPPYILQYEQCSLSTQEYGTMVWFTTNPFTPRRLPKPWTIFLEFLHY